MPKGKHACRHDRYGAGTGVISAAIISRHDENLTRVLMNAWSCDVVAASACMQAFIVAPRCMQPEAGRVWQLPGRPRVTPDSKGRPKKNTPCESVAWESPIYAVGTRAIQTGNRIVTTITYLVGAD